MASDAFGTGLPGGKGNKDSNGEEQFDFHHDILGSKFDFLKALFGPSDPELKGRKRKDCLEFFNLGSEWPSTFPQPQTGMHFALVHSNPPLTGKKPYAVKHLMDIITALDDLYLYHTKRTCCPGFDSEFRQRIQTELESTLRHEIEHLSRHDELFPSRMSAIWFFREVRRFCDKIQKSEAISQDIAKSRNKFIALVKTEHERNTWPSRKAGCTSWDQFLHDGAPGSGIKREIPARLALPKFYQNLSMRLLHGGITKRS
jgi:hypothetical protein